MLHTNPGTVQGIRSLPRRDSNGAGPDRRTQADLGRLGIHQGKEAVSGIMYARNQETADKLTWKTAGTPVQRSAQYETEGETMIGILGVKL